MFARIALMLAVLALTLAGAAVAAAPPVGPLPPGPTTKISVKAGELFAVALPGVPGRSWRLKGGYDPRLVHELTEANVGSSIVVVFKASGRGTTKLAYGATRGETAKAYSAKRFTITVS
jgi:hypothetical protein